MEHTPLFCIPLLAKNPFLMFHGAGMHWPRVGRHRMIPPVDTEQRLYTFLFNCEGVNAYVDGVATPLKPLSLALWDENVSVDYGEAGISWHVSWLQFWGAEADRVLEGVERNCVRSFPDDLIELRYFGGIIDEIQRYKRPNVKILGALLKCLALEHSRRGSVLEERLPVEESLLEAKKRIEARYRTPSQTTLPLLARKAGMSISHFSRKYKAAFGSSPLDYAMSLRLNEIVARMADPNVNLSEIAKDAGFANMSNFSRTFRRRFGVSPSTCKKRKALSASH